ncbi:3-deoxy-manno-octulosonate cytidylyltransferase [Urechidicola sp. KH5]
MKVVAMIPARLGATRFPRKLLQDLKGKTVIQRTFEGTVASNLFDEVYVVTDSQEIFDHIENVGGKVLLSQKEHESGSDRIAEAASQVDADIIVNVQGDEPFIAVESIRSLLNVFVEDISQEVDMVSLMFPISERATIENPNNVKVVTDVSDFAMYFSRAPIPFDRDGSLSGKYFKHIGIYAFRKEALLKATSLPLNLLETTEKLEQLRFIAHGIKIKMVPTHEQPIGIDTPEDLQEAIKKLTK